MARLKLWKATYGAVFAVALPICLVLWAAAARRNVSLPTFGGVWTGQALAICGLAVMASAMLELWKFGGGLPMNAFPPPRLVGRGAYRWIPHPIYTGFVVISLGISLARNSPSGFWLITPSVALGCAALVLGYERLDLLRRFGTTLRILPAGDKQPPTAVDRAHFYLCVLVPWIALYELTIHLPSHGVAFKLSFEDRIGVWPWTVLVYQSIYAAVAAAPFCARTRRDLRRLMVSAWVSMAVVFPFYWLLPSAAPRRAFESTTWMGRDLRFECGADPPLAAFPSFHVLWALFVARLYRHRWVGISYAAAVSASCITTGMHFAADVAFALLLAPIFLYPSRLWQVMRGASERLANSWQSWRIGPFRIINYGVFAGLAAFLQVAVVMSAIGPNGAYKALGTALAGLVGSALWAQWVEGSPSLRRPYGFYGGFLGVTIVCLLFRERWVLMGANCLGAPWMQAIGRLRCLVNGCCHGAPSSEDVGIRVCNGRSRVVRLANLAGAPIHATQLYSVLSNAILGCVLLRMWASGCPLSLFCGVYMIGNGCARFAEEAYRGEPQTMQFGGLRFYQWMAIGMVLSGAALTCLSSLDAPALRAGPAVWLGAGAFGLAAAFALGVEFPESNRRFARLT